MIDNSAFLEGYEGYWSRVDPDDNPYPSETNEHFCWDQGWSQAQLEDDQQRAE